jgi:hypothetical protein
MIVASHIGFVIGFGAFCVLALVLIGFVISFARSLSRTGRRKGGGGSAQA